MAEKYSDKVFEFSNSFVEKNEWAGKIRIMQVGETCLDKGASINEHIQICHEITFIISGEGMLTADREKTPCSVGDIQIISKGTKHNITANENNRLRYIHFAFDFDDYEPRALSEFYGQCKNVIIRDDGNLRLILNMLVDEYFNPVAFTDIARNSLVQLVLVQIWRNVNEAAQRYKPVISREPIGSTVYNIIRYIDKNISDKLTVTKLAQHFSYSSSYISHLFKSKTGVSLKEYIIAMRMKYANTLLSEGKSSLSEISELTGYESIQSFCKAFKKYTGCTPGELKGE